jgi:uncharacterized protein (TIGR02145 family)
MVYSHRNPKHAFMKIKAAIVLASVFLLTLSACRKDTSVPEITTLSVQNIAYFTANCGGLVEDDGGLEITHRGVCWSTNPNPTINDDTTLNLNEKHYFVARLSGLEPSTTYYIRAYAINEKGTAYGKEITFTTLDGSLPEAATHEISDIASILATAKGEVVSDGDVNVRERGFCWSTSPNPTIDDNKRASGSGKGVYTALLTDLAPNTNYHVKAYAINDAGITYGNELQFTTNPPETLPEIETVSISGLNQWSANSGGIILHDGGGTISERGICWSKSPNPSVSNQKILATYITDTFSINMYSLEHGKTYYVRAFVKNLAGIAYGNEVSFTTLQIGASCPGVPTITDVEGNEYTTLQAGEYCWLRENLRVTKFRDGSDIQRIHYNTSIPAYTGYDNYSPWIQLYGALYNWYAVNSAIGICPEGWHVATRAEWDHLFLYMTRISDSYNIAEKITTVKSSRVEPTPHPRWDQGGIIGNDLGNFSALPGGVRRSHFGFTRIGRSAYWWTSNSYTVNPVYPDRAFSAQIYNDKEFIYTPIEHQSSHLSVRCVKDY